MGQLIKRFNKQVIKTNEKHRALGIQKKQKQIPMNENCRA